MTVVDNYKCVLFHFSTLFKYESFEKHIISNISKIWFKILEKYGITEDDLKRVNFNHTDSYILQSILNKTKIKLDISHDEIINLVNELYINTKISLISYLKPNLYDFLNELKRNGFKIGLIHYGNRKHCRYDLNSLGLSHIFTIIVNSSVLIQSKLPPYKELYNEAIMRMHVHAAYQLIICNDLHQMISIHQCQISPVLKCIYLDEYKTYVNKPICSLNYFHLQENFLKNLKKILMEKKKKIFFF